VPWPVAGVKIGEGKVPSTSAAGDGEGHALALAVDLFASSASDEETVSPKPYRKLPRSSPPSKAMLKPSDASAVKGTTMCGVYFCLYKAIILIFIDAASAIESGSASTDAHAKDLGHKDVHADEQLGADGSASA
jgi:hypothetical protein